MGRTLRKRNSKAYRNTYSIDKTSEVISLNKWIKVNGFKKIKKMCLANFAETGRGVMALENVKAGDTLMEVPFTLIISIYTLQMDQFFSLLFTANPNFKHKPQSCQSLLSFYLVYLKVIKKCSFWSHYMDSLPGELTIPYFCSKKQLDCLDEGILENIETQKSDINTSYLFFKYMLQSHTLPVDINIHSFYSLFTLELYAWAYFIVNSRSVYLDPESVTNLMHPMNKWENFLCDPPNMGLVPYLDMFNHSTRVNTEATLIPPAKTSQTFSTYIDDGDFPRFRLVSLSPFSKHHQIFISYGQHGNLKLVTEYGFSLPFNQFTTVNFTFDSICDHIKYHNSVLGLSKEKFRYITKHKINADIYVDHNGFSYNFLRLLFILSNSEKSTWDAKMFSSDFGKTDFVKMYEIAKPILKSKVKMYSKFICKLSPECRESIAIQCLSLYKEYVLLIERLLFLIDL